MIGRAWGLAASLSLAAALSAPAAVAQDKQAKAQAPKAEAKSPRSPNQIIAEAPASDWVAIAPEDLLVMTLAPDAGGNSREVVIQLIGKPFSQGWVENIRTLAKAHWYDGNAITRVQDNYVVQWGDPNAEDKAKAKPLPAGLKVMGEREYVSTNGAQTDVLMELVGSSEVDRILRQGYRSPEYQRKLKIRSNLARDPYAYTYTSRGFPLASDGRELESRAWPVHCYGMVGVGRDLSPDTGSGAELYTVIGHAPRHLDRNIAVVGRIVEGMEHLSSLPRGKGELGFYEDESNHMPITSIRLASELPAAEQPKFEYFNTESSAFNEYVAARANRGPPFFIKPAGGVDICNVPIPVRRIGSE